MPKLTFFVCYLEFFLYFVTIFSQNFRNPTIVHTCREGFKSEIRHLNPAIKKRVYAA